jgi:hypothetical protein
MIVRAGWLSQHGTHVLLLVIPAALLTIVGIAFEGRAWLHRHGRVRPEALVLVAALLSGVAATVHGIVCPEHFRESLLYGGFFAVAAGAQVAWAALVVLRSHRWLVVAGLTGNLAILALWAVTRTIGVPLGPGAGEIEEIGVLDIVATVCEVGVVACCAWLLIRARARTNAKAETRQTLDPTAATV